MSGDAVLCEIATIARGQVRREHCLARIDGDAFAVALTETEVAAARLFAERLRGTIEVHEFHAGGDAIPVTISAGVAAMSHDTAVRSAFVAAAEAQLALAKEAGRNRSAG
jgi:diguanylate cyclase (GGDEF)-like protein